MGKKHYPADLKKIRANSWTIEELEYLETFRNVGMTFKRFGPTIMQTMQKGLMEKFGVHRTTSAIRGRVKKSNIPIRALNIDKFDKIDTKESSYFLGVVGSDGNKSGNIIKLQVSIVDRDWVEKFKNFIGKKQRIKELPASEMVSPLTGKIYIRKPQVSFGFCCPRASSALEKLGITENKSLTYEFPTENIVPIEFAREYVRGSFDGDGSWWWIYDKNKNPTGARASFTSGSEAWIKGLEKLLKQALGEGFRCSICEKKGRKLQKGGFSQSSWELTVACHESVLMFTRWMYEGSTYETRLNRKYEKSLEIIEFCQQAVNMRNEFLRAKIIVKDSNGKIHEVTEENWASFCCKHNISANQKTALRTGKTKETAGSRTDSKSHISSGFSIINIEEVSKRKIVHHWH